MLRSATASWTLRSLQFQNGVFVGGCHVSDFFVSLQKESYSLFVEKINCDSVLGEIRKGIHGTNRAFTV